MHATQKFTGDFRFIEARASDQQAAVPDHITLGAPLYGEKTDAACVGLHVLLGEVSLGLGEAERGAALVLTQQFEIPRRVFWAAPS
jgi:hypothetical protein